MDVIFGYILEGGFVTTFVFVWLSIYFILTIWVYISRTLTLGSWKSVEQASLESLLQGNTRIRQKSVLSKCVSVSKNSNASYELCKSVAEKNATNYLALLSMISSTSPFIGLFGTIVSILNTFSKLGSETSASLNVIAPAISEALVVTAVGIFVAIPAYSAHILLKRKAYELLSIINREIELLNNPISKEPIESKKKYEF